jgi:hypothetical protein
VKDKQIQHQHAHREQVEENPEVEQVRSPIVDCRLLIGAVAVGLNWQLEIAD